MATTDNLENITPAGSACPVYRAPVDTEQQAIDAAEAQRVTAEQAAALEARKAPLRRLGLTEDEINTVLGL